MDKLTDIQQAVYEFVRTAQRRGRPFPSLREIAAQFGFQHTTARFHLQALEKKGYILKRAQRVSDYRLSDEVDPNPDHNPDHYQFDLVARIPAGAPQAVYDETPESFVLTHDFFGGGDIVAIRVSGDNMAGDAIADGDIAMIRRQPDGGKHDILALRIDGEITLKRLRLDGAEAELLPSNPLHDNRRVPADRLEILGKLVGIVRKV